MRQSAIYKKGMVIFMEQESKSNTSGVEGVSAEYEEKQKINAQYQAYIDEITPKHSIGRQIAKAFFVGGIICCLGQLIMNLMTEQLAVDTKSASIWCSIILILISDLLTGFGLYAKIVRFGGAGALVPITGFANSISSTAIEYKKEGWVFGVGCKIFTIAGPVILYGIFTSWVLGIIYIVMQKYNLF